MTSTVQFFCAIGVLVRSTAPWAAMILTLTTIGAAGAHLRIGSPETAVAAAIFTGIQVWFALRARGRGA